MKQLQEMSMRERVNNSLANHWRLGIVVLSLVVVLMGGILILDTVRRNKIVEANMLAEDIQDAYVEWMREDPEERDDAGVFDLIEKALKDYPRHFAAQRAFFTRGLMALENEKWEEASTNFQELVNTWDDSYLVPVSLSNIAAAKEESGDIEGARLALESLVNEYSDIASDIPETLFHLGRIAETENKREVALEWYSEMATRFPDSRWTDLAKSRILVIEERF